MYGILDVTTSGMIAQRTRMTTISANLANRETLVDENGDYAPYRRRFVLFSPGDAARGSELGVQVSEVAEDQGPLRMKYEPGSPFADGDGYVGYPNVDPIIEAMDAMEAARAYEANVTVAEATKSMITVALQLLA